MRKRMRETHGRLERAGKVVEGHLHRRSRDVSYFGAQPK
jgi:hypothetical protein